MATLVYRQTAAEALREADSVSAAELPRLLPGITLIPITTGLVAHGGEQPQLFGGKSARTVLPAVLRAMDGTRTTAEIAELLRLPLSTVDAVHALARNRRLLGSGPEADDDSSRWLARARAAVTTSPSASSVPAVQTEVCFTGDPALARELADLLAEDGITGTIVDWAGDLPDQKPGLVVVVLAGPEPVQELVSLDRALTAAEVPWLRVVVDARGAEIGPRFAPRDELRYESWWPVSPPRVAHQIAAGVRQAALGFAALEVLNLVTGAGRPLSAIAVTEFDAAQGTCRPRPRAPRPADPASSVCLAAGYLARNSAPATPPPPPARTGDEAVETITDPGLARLLAAAFPGADEENLGAYLLVPPGSGRRAGAHLYRPAQAGLLDLAGVSDAGPWLRRHADGAIAVIAVSVIATYGSGAEVITQGLLDTGAALARLCASARDLGLRVRDDVGGSLGELAGALGSLAQDETLLEVVVLERVAGGQR